MRATQSRYKSYADWRRRPLEFEVGDWAFLKVSPTKVLEDLVWSVSLAQCILALIPSRN